MNILLISHFFPPHKGGVETATYNTAKTLARFGHKVYVMTSKYQKSDPRVVKTERFWVYRFHSFNIPEIRFFPQISSFGITPMAMIKLPILVKKLNIQVIHIEGRLFPISVFSALMNILVFKRPMILTVQGRLQVGLSAIFENIFDILITKTIYKKLKKIICVSKSLKDRFLKLGIKPNKLTVIPNGVNTTFFVHNNSLKFLDNYIEGKKDYKKVIFVGRLDKQKGVEYLIRAIPLVLSNYKKVHFFILGNGILEKKLKGLAASLNLQSHITFLNMVPWKKMPRIYSSADIFCLPSIHEGFPLTIAEALSMGLVIVASDTEGIPDAIKENKNGFLVELKNTNQLAEKLIIALNLKTSKIQEIQKNNVKLARDKYSWENITNQIIKVYKE